MSSSSVTSVAKKAAPFVAPTTFFGTKAAPAAAGFLGASAMGPIMGVGTYFAAKKYKDMRDQIKAEKEAATKEEESRQRFNEKIFNTAQELSGSLAQNTSFDLNQLNFVGSDSNTETLSALVKNLRARQGEIQQRRSAPGLTTQTRVSLLG